MTRLAVLLVAVMLAAPAQARPWHWRGNTLVADGGWRWNILARSWERHARAFRPGFGSPVLVVRPIRQRPAMGMIYIRQNGLWAGYGWRRSYALTRQAIAHNALCANELRRVYGRAELPRRCWE